MATETAPLGPSSAACAPRKGLARADREATRSFVGEGSQNAAERFRRSAAVPETTQFSYHERWRARRTKRLCMLVSYTPLAALTFLRSTAQNAA